MGVSISRLQWMNIMASLTAKFVSLFVFACVFACVCVLDTWSLNRVFRMSLSVYFSVQGSLQRSFMSLQLENKHISRHTHIHDHFLVSRFWRWSHDCVNYHYCVLRQIQHTNLLNDYTDSS